MLMDARTPQMDKVDVNTRFSFTKVWSVTTLGYPLSDINLTHTAYREGSLKVTWDFTKACARVSLLIPRKSLFFSRLPWVGPQSLPHFPSKYSHTHGMSRLLQTRAHVCTCQEKPISQAPAAKLSLALPLHTVIPSRSAHQQKFNWLHTWESRQVSIFCLILNNWFDLYIYIYIYIYI